MHELSIALSILEVAEEEAERRGSAQVEAIHLTIGPLSGVVKDALMSAYQLATEETAFADCRLVIEETPITIYCSTCEAECRVESIQRICCADCGTPSSDVVKGKELLVSALELSE